MGTTFFAIGCINSNSGLYLQNTIASVWFIDNNYTLEYASWQLATIHAIIGACGQGQMGVSIYIAR